MIRRAASKVMWVGRATVLPAVLAVMLVVVFGVSSPAKAHGGYKGLLHLNHSRVATNTTTLVGNILDAAKSTLLVTNTGGGSALELQVNGGAAPLTVNADAGTATNLDADQLDGQDSSQFFGASTDTYTKSLSLTGEANRWKQGGAYCNQGDKMLSGGFWGIDYPDSFIQAEYPLASQNGWYIQYKSGATADDLTVYVLCADV